MHFICLRHKFRVATFNRIFFAWNITTNLFRWVDGGLLFHNAHCIVVTPSNCEFLVGSCYVIDLQVSLVCPRSFICLRYVLASVVGNESFVTMYFRFSAVRGDRDRWMETSRGIAICAERVMHTCKQEEKIAAVRSIALEASTRRIYCVLLIPRLTSHE